ncbi:MAG: sulfotransferase family protein [Chitinivibrionales bacterium]
MRFPPVFIGGAGRSGTTLVRVMLESHSCISCGPELKVTVRIAEMLNRFRGVYKPFLSNYNVTPDYSAELFRELLQGIFNKSLDRTGKKRIAEKTPGNSLVFPMLHTMFRDSPLVHVIRDGRDVVTSLLSMDWRDPSGRPVPYTQETGEAARYWVRSVAYARDMAEKNSYYNGKYTELRYEDIVSAPKETLEGLLSFIGEEWEEGVLEFYKQDRVLAGESSADQVKRGIYSSSVGRWKQGLSKEQKGSVYEIAGDLLMELGYCDCHEQ